MKCVNQPALFPPGWLERTSSDPKLAAQEIEEKAVELERVMGENSRVRRERDKLRRETERYDAEFRSMQAELERERRAARSSNAARVETERLLGQCRRLSDADAQKARDLEHRVRKLERAVVKAQARRAGGRLVSAIEKLAKGPVGKRLAAAVHPDKAPAECSELATELFKFVQGARESPCS